MEKLKFSNPLEFDCSTTIADNDEYKEATGSSTKIR